MVATHDFYPMNPTIWMLIITFSRVVVKWNVIFFNLLFFLMKLLKHQKMGDWNELSSIAGKWKFCWIYWQWILIEQTSHYTVVYRTFLYNPTNLKVPKKAPCWTSSCATSGYRFYRYNHFFASTDDLPLEKECGVFRQFKVCWRV